MRKTLCIILILIICFISRMAYAENEVVDENATNSTNSTDLQTQQQQLQEQIDQANQELSETQSQLSDNLKEIEELDQKIEDSENELNKLNEQVQALKDEISSVETELAEVTEKYEAQKEIFEKRVVALYETGEVSYLDILLNSSSVYEFVSSYYVISEIAEADNDLLTSIGDKKDEIELKKRTLDKEKENLAALVETQQRTSKILQNTKIIRENYVSKLSEEEKAKQAQIDEMTAQYKAINTQILELLNQGIDTEYIGGELAWPVPGYTRITSKYGMRVHPITGQYKLHTGVDISAPMGANFIAANDGIVVKAEYNTAYGRMVVIDHGGGISTLYAHGNEILVQVGQTVKRGDSILKVGSSGYSTGPHAHFEVRINGTVTDPMPYITNGIVPGTEEDEAYTNEVNTNTTNQY